MTVAADRGDRTRGSREIVVIDRDLELEGLSGWWNGLPQAQASPAMRWEWLALWSQVFMPSGGRLQVYVVFDDGAPVAAVPLFRARRRLFALANTHSAVFDAGWEPNTPDALDDLIVALSSQRLHLVRLDSSSPFLDRLRAHGVPSIEDPPARSPHLELPTTPDALLATRSRNVRSRTRRAVRHLGTLGEVTFAVRRADEPDAEDILEEFLQLEGSGWKGRAGTALVSRPETLRFYRQLLSTPRVRDWVRLECLRVNDELVAASCSLEYGSGRHLLKTAYEEDLPTERSQSPGLALTWAVLQDCIEHGLSTYDFLGDAERWKLDWTSSTRARHTVLTWPPTLRGRTSCLVRRRVKPLVSPMRRRMHVVATSSRRAWKRQVLSRPVPSGHDDQSWHPS